MNCPNCSNPNVKFLIDKSLIGCINYNKVFKKIIQWVEITNKDKNIILGFLVN